MRVGVSQGQSIEDKIRSLEVNKPDSKSNVTWVKENHLPMGIYYRASVGEKDVVVGEDPNGEGFFYCVGPTGILKDNEKYESHGIVMNLEVAKTRGLELSGQ